MSLNASYDDEAFSVAPNINAANINIGAPGNTGAIVLNAQNFESGSWTPRFCQQVAQNTDPAVSLYEHTIVINDAKYQRVGNMVTAWCTYTITAKSAAHGTASLARPILSFLPYEVAGATDPSLMRDQGHAEGNFTIYDKGFNTSLGSLDVSGVNAMHFILCNGGGNLYEPISYNDVAVVPRICSIRVNYYTTDTGVANHFRDSF